MDLDFQTGALLLLIAGIVAMLTSRLRLPYSVGLVVAGIVLSISPVAPTIVLTKELLFTVLLPPLLFEATLNIPWPQLRRDFPVIVTLATAGVALSAGVTSAGMHYLAHWAWPGAMVFGVLIAATDPVSVIAVFREAKAHGRLLMLIETESSIQRWHRRCRICGCCRSGFRTASHLLCGCIHAAENDWRGILCGAAVAGAALLLVG